MSVSVSVSVSVSAPAPASVSESVCLCVYACAQVLQEKVMLAVREGREGFELH